MAAEHAQLAAGHHLPNFIQHDRPAAPDHDQHHRGGGDFPDQRQRQQITQQLSLAEQSQPVQPLHQHPDADQHGHDHHRR